MHLIFSAAPSCCQALDRWKELTVAQQTKRKKVWPNEWTHQKGQNKQYMKFNEEMFLFVVFLPCLIYSHWQRIHPLDPFCQLSHYNLYMSILLVWVPTADYHRWGWSQKDRWRKVNETSPHGCWVYCPWSVKTLVSWESLGVQLLLLWLDRSQFRRFGHLTRMPHVWFRVALHQSSPTGQRPQVRPRTRWKNHISQWFGDARESSSKGLNLKVLPDLLSLFPLWSPYRKRGREINEWKIKIIQFCQFFLLTSR